MPVGDIDDLVDPWFNRFMNSMRCTFLSGVFGCILTICSFLAIPFAATLHFYNTAIIVCILIGVSFLTMCCYCCRAWCRLRLGDFLYRYRQPQRIPRFDVSSSANIKNEDALDDSNYAPVADSNLSREKPSQLYDSSGACSEANPLCASSKDAICSTYEYTDQTMPSTSTTKTFNFDNEPHLQFLHQSTGIKAPEGNIGRQISSDIEKGTSDKIIFPSMDSKLFYQPYEFESIKDTFLTTASMPDISETREPVNPVSDESLSSDSETLSVGRIISNIIVNLPIYNKVINESRSDTSSSIENATPKYKKETSSTSISLVDSEKVKIKGADTSVMGQELSSKSSKMKRSRSEKDAADMSKSRCFVEVHDSSKSGQRTAGDLTRRRSISAPPETLEEIRILAMECFLQYKCFPSRSNVSSCRSGPSTADADKQSELREFSDDK